jgi:hypothetical protein
MKNLDYPFADRACMLLSNLAKAPGISLLARLKNGNDLLLGKLIDVYTKGVDKALNKSANYDYLAFCFGDLTKVWKCTVCLL